MWTPLHVRCTWVVPGLNDVDPKRVQCTLVVRLRDAVDPVRVQCTQVVRVLLSAGHRTIAVTRELALQRTLLATRQNGCRSTYERDDYRAGFTAHALGDVLESVDTHSKAFLEDGENSN